MEQILRRIGIIHNVFEGTVEGKTLGVHKDWSKREIALGNAERGLADDTRR